MHERQTIISKDTLIPLGLVITIIGGVVWLTTMYVDLNYMKKKVDKIDEILYRITVIEQHLKDNNQLSVLD